MERSKVKNKCLKLKSEADKQKDKKHKNYCAKLLCFKKQVFYELFDISKITDNKTFRRQ